ncbi:hypothetical protein DSL92_05935 [Billgrantia gudaonensis]|uniref:Uncharacterized protein n=1 Tax=Billgrantia gudaonensis TaxID=376427 RepID=A0A3S0VSR3_9GAMM|nr:hypothetical protein DSL92_05935 [Halomonas gudaonensis]
MPPAWRCRATPPRTAPGAVARHQPATGREPDRHCRRCDRAASAQAHRRSRHPLPSRDASRLFEAAVLRVVKPHCG